VCLAVGVASAASASVPSCSALGTGWCLARRFPGLVPAGELGFRFGEPLDMDGDGRADVAVGARFKRDQGKFENGMVAVWSGASGALIRRWDGEWMDGFFGHWVLPMPDVSGDGLADVVIAAPNARVGGLSRGIVVARSPKSGAEIWRLEERDGENLGWDMALAGDQNGDGHVDVFIGAPSEPGRVYLVSGKDGRVLRTYDSPARAFGWFVAGLDDVDGDGRADLLVGAPYAANGEGVRVGSASVLSSASGKELRHWTGTDPLGAFGAVVAALADLDGDGKREIAVAAPATEDQKRVLPGELWIYSGATGKELRHWTGSQPGELYGRLIVDAGDLDGDGVGDVAIGAPAYRRGDADRVGRIELRSGKRGTILAELQGDEADCWFGWHIRRAPDPDGRGRPALLVSSLRHPVDGQRGVGLLDLLVLRRTSGAGDHGTITRGMRRKDIK